MFYVVNPNGSFLAGFLPAGTRESIMFEGQMVQGEPKITKRLEGAASSSHDAWEFMCEMVSEARADGYLDTAFTASKLQVPADLHHEEFPLVLRGFYARVKTMAKDQFAAGLARLRAVHEVLSHADVQLQSYDDDKFVELRLGAQIIRFGFVPERLWEIMTTKAKELCESRGMLDDNYLLPDGRGLLHLRTRETILDVYVRAFLQGAIRAGAVIELTSDHNWRFLESNPFIAADVKHLQWYQDHPEVLSSVLKLDQTIPVRATQVFSAVVFYC